MQTRGVREQMADGDAVLAVGGERWDEVGDSLLERDLATLMLSGLAARLTPKQTPGPLGALAVGAVSGALNGAVGISGPPAIVFYFATTAVATSRATLIAYFLFTDVWALALAGGAGLLTEAALPLITVALPFSLAGIWLGQRLYLRLSDDQMRRLVWTLLAVLGAVVPPDSLHRMLAP